MYQFIHTKSLKLYQLPAELSVHVLLDHTKALEQSERALMLAPHHPMYQKTVEELRARKHQMSTPPSRVFERVIIRDQRRS